MKLSPASLSIFLKVDFAIFSAMPEELEFFDNTFSEHKYELTRAGDFEFKIYEYNGKKILLAQTGLGATFAASVLTFVYCHFHPNYIFLSGTAGGIKSGLKLRDVIIVEKAFEAEIQGAFKSLEGTPFASCLEHPLKKQRFPSTYSADEELLEIASSIDYSDTRVFRGTIVSSNVFPAPQELFEKIKSRNAYAIDMESSAACQVAWLLKIPVLAVRGISNVLNQDGTDDQIDRSDVKGSSAAAAKVLLKIIDKLILKLNAHKIHNLETNKEVDIDVAQLITRFNLQPHPEGGHYARSFQSKTEIKSLDKERYNDETRSSGTAIYYLLKGDDFSAWHSLKSDEIWHYCKGSPAKIHVIDQRGELQTYLLGDPLVHEDARFQVAILADNWFAAEVVDKASYSFVGCTVSPGFDFKDFKLADRQLLSEQFPRYRAIISQFTRLSSKKPEDCEEARVTRTKLLSRL